MNRKTFIDKTIVQARKKWAYDEQWVITWKFSDQATKDGGGRIVWEPVGEKCAAMELSSEYETSTDLKRIRRDIYHELGHPIISAIWRTSTDWADHLIKGKKMRAVFEESMNSAENLVLDHIITQIFGV